jgi:hypothetical protein
MASIHLSDLLRISAPAYRPVQDAVPVLQMTNVHLLYTAMKNGAKMEDCICGQNKAAQCMRARRES